VIRIICTSFSDMINIRTEQISVLISSFDRTHRIEHLEKEIVSAHKIPPFSIFNNRTTVLRTRSSCNGAEPAGLRVAVGRGNERHTAGGQGRAGRRPAAKTSGRARTTRTEVTGGSTTEKANTFLRKTDKQTNRQTDKDTGRRSKQAVA
jgi:hypothetical protein